MIVGFVGSLLAPFRASVAENSVVVAALETAAAAQHRAEILAESLADLELALDDEGWTRLTAGAEREFSREGLAKAARTARVYAIANPLIRRALSVRTAYVHGAGVTIQARSTGGDDGAQDVNQVVQAFLDDVGNKQALTGAQARETLERALGTDGNFFVACFTNPRTGFVQARTLSFDEITDVITNPEDAGEAWFYERRWTQRVLTATGALETQSRVAYYPALTYRPAARLKVVNGHPVLWDAPVRHVHVNGLSGWSFGIGDAYAALPWARAYRDFLGDWAVLVKSLSQFAWRSTSKGSKAQAARAALTRRPTTDAPAGNPNTVGATALLPQDVSLEAIPKSGATIDSDSGRPLAAMVAAATDISVVTLLADPGTTGARAVAETLDKPTELVMTARRDLWAEALTDILTYAITQAVRAPQGPLRGTITRDPVTGRETVALAGDTDPTIEVVWPDLTQTPVETIVKAIVEADSTTKLPPLVTLKLLLHALGVEEVDEILVDVTDDQGRWVDPTVTAGQAAVDAYRRGEDPAGVV